jgi:glycosyltransferase involved in cell wall biosynthesis
MIQGKKLVVVMPAYNAEKTLRQTFGELPHEYVDEVILVDDASSINFSRSVTYGFGVLSTAMKYRLRKSEVRKDSLFQK